MTTRETLLAEAAGIMRALNIDSTGKNFGRVLDEYNKTIMAANVAESIASQTTAPAPAEQRVTRQYYYRDNDCKASGAYKPDCICWHDEGTGPLKSGEGSATWRDKSPAPAEHTAADAPIVSATNTCKPSEGAAAGVPDVDGLIADLRSVASRPLAQETFADTWLTKAATALAALQSQQKIYEDLWRAECEESARRANQMSNAFQRITELERENAQQAERIKELEALSVTKIMLDVVPGERGEGEEIYAKSVAEVEAVMSKDGLRIDDLQGRINELKAKLAEAVEVFRWLNMRGGLGLDVHERISIAIQKTSEVRG